jgi:hypothetical protein
MGFSPAMEIKITNSWESKGIKVIQHLKASLALQENKGLPNLAGE